MAEETAKGLFARVHVAHMAGGRLKIPAKASPIIVEIGTSDRDTADVELLPHYPSGFLVSLEPMLDKYARGLARQPRWAGDTWQPLGQHHKRGFVLPFAVSPDAGVVTLNAGANSGCSSVLPTARNASFGYWCKDIKERRQVPSVTLETVLRWVGRTVDLLKIEAKLMREAEASGTKSKSDKVVLWTDIDGNDYNECAPPAPPSHITRTLSSDSRATDASFRPTPVHAARRG